MSSIRPRAVTGLAVDGQPGQLLQRLEHLAVAPDQLLQVRTDDRDRRAVTLDVHVQVAVEVGDVEQLLEVVRRDVALLLELLQPAAAGDRRVGSCASAGLVGS